MKPAWAIVESIVMALIGVVAIALIDVFTDFHIFSPHATTWLRFVVPALVGIAIGMAHPNFRLNLGIAIGVAVASIAAYFWVYALLHFPPISFSGVGYPPDPAQRFIIYFMLNAVTVLGGVTIGGFMSGE